MRVITKWLKDLFIVYTKVSYSNRGYEPIDTLVKLYKEFPKRFILVNKIDRGSFTKITLFKGYYSYSVYFKDTETGALISLHLVDEYVREGVSIIYLETTCYGCRINDYFIYEGLKPIDDLFSTRSARYNKVMLHNSNRLKREIDRIDKQNEINRNDVLDLYGIKEVVC